MSSINESEKQAAMDLAEDSREAEWKHPSFVGELFQGRFRWDMISPFPEQDEEDKAIGTALIEKVKVALESTLNPEEVDQTGEIPQAAFDALAELGIFGMKRRVRRAWKRGKKAA